MNELEKSVSPCSVWSAADATVCPVLPTSVDGGSTVAVTESRVRLLP